MKTLLIHTVKDNKIADRLSSLLKEMNIIVENLSIKSHNEKFFTQFIAFFGLSDSERKDEERANAPTHVIILSALSKRWFDFLAGFSCGSHLPFIIYGQETITGIAEEFASCFTFLHNDASLQMFFNAENEAFKKQEAARETLKAQKTLLQMGISVTGESLSQCVSEGRVEEVSLFLTAGFSPNARNKSGVPLLNIATRTGNREIIRFLIMAGAQLNLQADDRGTSALIDGVMGNYIDPVNDLINAGADVNIKSKDGQTALVVAAGACNEKMVEALLKAGADPDISDSLGVSARKYAKLFHQNAIIRLFDIYNPQKE
ncbi:MAG: ankyrin repeat domain-containing protein [Treponema sp.]|jgi:hypothetical protein|nr:ankyrin repeat domain-containing protein [Treponema sp.]